MQEVTSVLFSPAKNVVASAIPDGTITLWRASDGQQIDELQHSDAGSPKVELDALSFSADGNMLALGTEKLYLHLINGWFLKDTTFEALTSLPNGGLPFNKSAVTVTGNSGTMILTLGLDDLLARNCAWAKNHLEANASTEDGDLCNGVEDVK